MKINYTGAVKPLNDTTTAIVSKLVSESTMTSSLLTSPSPLPSPSSCNSSKPYKVSKPNQEADYSSTPCNDDGTEEVVNKLLQEVIPDGSPLSSCCNYRHSKTFFNTEIDTEEDDEFCQFLQDAFL